MKVRVSYSVDVSPEYRRAINIRFGRAGLATREQVRNWLERNGSSQDEDLMEAFYEAKQEFVRGLIEADVAGVL